MSQTTNTMSSDDKNKASANKGQVMATVCQDIDNQDIVQAMRAIEFKRKWPILVSLVNQSDSSGLIDPLNVNIDPEKGKEVIRDALLERCDLILELLTGEGCNDESQGKKDHRECIRKLIKEVVKMRSQLRSEKEVDDEITKKYKEFLKELLAYLSVEKKLLSDYYIGHKLVHDETDFRLLLTKVETIAMRKRHEETDAVFRKYGSQQKVDQLKKERRALEEEDRKFQHEEEFMKAQLEKYQKLPPHLLHEYAKLKTELASRQWVMDEMNTSLDM